MPASQPAVLAGLTDIFRTVFEDRALELNPDMTPDDIPAWDSMTHITLIVEAECRFNVRFDAGEIEQLKSVRELVRQIESLSSSPAERGVAREGA